MIESKREKFERIRDTRLPKAIKSIELLKNLGRRVDYDYTEAMARGITDQLYDAVDGVADALGLPPAEEPVEDAPPAPPENDEPVRAPHRSRVRWAHDMLKRGDRKDAEAVLKQIIAEWIEDERAT